jgi:hypothetical protein
MGRSNQGVQSRLSLPSTAPECAEDPKGLGLQWFPFPRSASISRSHGGGLIERSRLDESAIERMVGADVQDGIGLEGHRVRVTIQYVFEMRHETGSGRGLGCEQQRVSGKFRKFWLLTHFSH